MFVMYGIANCDTIKKARAWCAQHNVDIEFHDYKKQGVPEHALDQWLNEVGFEVLINKRGTTWRKLDDATREHLDAHSAKAIMLANPSVIKRPVITGAAQLLVGFNAEQYQQLLCG